MKTKNRFRKVFRKVPSVYRRRKAYHKAFRYMEKHQKGVLIDIDLLLWNLGEFHDSPGQLKSLFRTLCATKDGECSHSKLPNTFIQSILSDMHEIPDEPLSEKNYKYCRNIALSSLDIPSFYPNFMLSEYIFDKSLCNSDEKRYVAVKINTNQRSV